MTGEPAPVVADDLAGLREAYVEAVLAPDARHARSLILDAGEAGVPAAQLYLKVLQPALQEIGSRWERAKISVAAEHLATQISQSVLAQLADRLSPGEGGAGRKAVVSCSPGEHHVLGGQMVADFLEADGWEVLLLGADVPAEELAGLAERERVDVVALSTALPQHLLHAGLACSALRKLDEPPFVVAGGRAFDGDEQRALAVGADAFAPDPEALLALLDERFGGGDPRSG